MIYVYIIAIVSTLSVLGYDAVIKINSGILSKNERLKNERVRYLYKREELLFNGIKEYIIENGIRPVDISEIKGAGVLSTGYNDIGIRFSYEVDNKVLIEQDIIDDEIKAKYKENYLGGKGIIDSKFRDIVEYGAYNDILNNKVYHRYQIPINLRP